MIKKLTLLLLAFPIFANGQILVKETDNENTRFIPGQYMKNGEAAIYFSENEYGYSEGTRSFQAEIFDFDLNPLKTFEFQTLTPYTITESRESTGTTVKSTSLPRQMGDVSGMPSTEDMDARKSAFINHVYETNRYFDSNFTIEALTENCRTEDDTVFITISNIAMPWGIPYQEYFQSADLYLDKLDKMGLLYHYAATITVYDGEWNTKTTYHNPVSNFYTPRCNDVAKMNHWNGGVYLPFSQTFFNDDEKFEYVRYKAEIDKGYSNIYMGGDNLFGITSSDRDGDGVEDYRSTHYGMCYTGFEVVSEDGEVIYTFPLPETTEEGAKLEFFKSDDSILAQLSFNWVNANNEYLKTVRFYRIDKTTGMTSVIKEEHHISAYPNPAAKGTPITIILSSDINSKRNLSLTNTNGQTIFTQAIESGSSQVLVPTSKLTSGLYILSVYTNNRIIETCKIIIK